jgi:hypothetical protein
MKNKIVIIGILLLLVISIGFGFWYFSSVPKIENLKQNTLANLDSRTYGKPDINNSAAKALVNDPYAKQSVWLSGICSPFQKNIQSIYLVETDSGVYPTTYLLESPNGKILKNLTFASSKPYSDTLSYIKSNCLADIFSNRGKYKEIYRNNDVSQFNEIDYAVEYAKYLKQQEQEKQIIIACGDPDSWVYYNTNNRKFPRSITKEELLLCVNLHFDVDPKQDFDTTFPFEIEKTNVLKAIEVSQSLK